MCRVYSFNSFLVMVLPLYNSFNVYTPAASWLALNTALWLPVGSIPFTSTATCLPVISYTERWVWAAWLSEKVIVALSLNGLGKLLNALFTAGMFISVASCRAVPL